MVIWLVYFLMAIGITALMALIFMVGMAFFFEIKVTIGKNKGRKDG